jgi:hypothetical protein
MTSSGTSLLGGRSRDFDLIKIDNVVVFFTQFTITGCLFREYSRLYGLPVSFRVVIGLSSKCPPSNCFDLQTVSFHILYYPILVKNMWPIWISISSTPPVLTWVDTTMILTICMYGLLDYLQFKIYIKKDYYFNISDYFKSLK